MARPRRLQGKPANLANALHNHACALENQGKHVDAEAASREAVALAQKVLGAQHPNTALHADRLGKTLLAQDKFADAVALLREALAARVALVDDGWSRWSTAVSLGTALAHLRQFAEAETLLLEAHENMRPPPDRAALKGVATRSLAELYAAWAAAEPGDIDRDLAAARWRDAAAAAK